MEPSAPRKAANESESPPTSAEPSVITATAATDAPDEIPKM